MLKVNKSVTVSGQSVFDGQIAASMSGNIDSESRKGNVNWSAMDQDVYNANKKQVRQDVADFNDIMYDLQDQMDSEAAAATADTTAPTADDGTNGVTPDATKTE